MKSLHILEQLYRLSGCRPQSPAGLRGLVSLLMTAAPDTATYDVNKTLERFDGMGGQSGLQTALTFYWLNVELVYSHAGLRVAPFSSCTCG